MKRYLLRKLAVRRNVTCDSSLHVGLGSVLWAPTSLHIGRDVYLGKNVTLQVDGSVGDGTMIANSVGIVGRSDHDIHAVGRTIRRAPWVGDVHSLSKRTKVGADVWIGYGAVVLSGVSIGDSAIVAAGSVVIHDIPANSIVAGNPARIIGERFKNAELEEHWRALIAQGVTLTATTKGGAQ